MVVAVVVMMMGEKSKEEGLDAAGRLELELGRAAFRHPQGSAQGTGSHDAPQSVCVYCAVQEQEQVHVANSFLQLLGFCNSCIPV